MGRARRGVDPAGDVEQAGAVRAHDLALEDLDRHVAGPLAAEVPAHAVGDGVEADVVVAQEAVLVVVPLPADVGRAPADDSH